MGIWRITIISHYDGLEAMDRRQFIASSTVLLTTGLAGCGGETDDQPEVQC